VVLLVDGGDATNGGQLAGHPWFGSPMKNTTHYTFELMEHKNGAGAALEFWYPCCYWLCSLKLYSCISAVASSSPEGYREEALRLLMPEATQVASQLRLEEDVPIRKSLLASMYLTPPSLAEPMLGLGNISTTNYTYYVSVGGKFSFLESTQRKNLNTWFQALETRYHWPISSNDTNAAYQLATQWLNAVSIDVSALTRDCRVSIRSWMPRGPTSKEFVPLYWVSWGRDHEPVALVEFLLPEKKILQLRVEKSEYIHREQIKVSPPGRHPTNDSGF